MELEGDSFSRTISVDDVIEKLIANVPKLIGTSLKRHAKCLTDSIVELCAQLEEEVAIAFAHELVGASRNQADAPSAASGGTVAEVRLAPSRRADSSRARQTSGSSAAGSSAGSQGSIRRPQPEPDERQLVVTGTLVESEQRRQAHKTMALIGEGSSAQKKKKLPALRLDDAPDDKLHQIVEGGSVEGETKEEGPEGLIGCATSNVNLQLRPASSKERMHEAASEGGTSQKKEELRVPPVPSHLRSDDAPDGELYQVAEGGSEKGETRVNFAAELDESPEGSQGSMRWPQPEPAESPEGSQVSMRWPKPESRNVQVGLTGAIPSQGRKARQSMALIGEGSKAQKKEKLRMQMSNATSISDGAQCRTAEGASTEDETKENNVGMIKAARAREGLNSLYRRMPNKMKTISLDGGLTKTPRAWIRWLALCPAFHCFESLMIVSNTILMGVEAQHTSRHEIVEVSFFRIELFFTLWYALELLIRVVGLGYSFFDCADGNGTWNYMDVALITVSLYDTLAHSMQSTSLGTIVRCARLLRLLRVLRRVPNGGALSTFKKMIVALMASASSMLWSLFFLMVVIYAFAIVFTSGVSDCLFHRVPGCSALDTATLDELQYRFGSLDKSTYTLYSCVAEPGWVFAADLLNIVDPKLFWLFLLFIHMTLYGLVQIINSIFVENAISSADRCKDLRIRARLDAKKSYTAQLRDIFNIIDADGSGEISKDELIEFLADDQFQIKMCLEALDLNTSDADTLFTLLDWDDDGTVDIGEFCDGCLKLKGEASSFDVNCLLWNFRKMSKRVVDLSDRCDEFFDVLKSRTDQAAELQAMRQTGLAFSATSDKVLEALQGSVQVLHQIGNTWTSRPKTTPRFPQEPSSTQLPSPRAFLGSLLSTSAPRATDLPQQ